MRVHHFIPWQERARCREHDPEVFFPEKGRRREAAEEADEVHRWQGGRQDGRGEEVDNQEGACEKAEEVHRSQDDRSEGSSAEVDSKEVDPPEEVDRQKAVGPSATNTT